MYIKYKVSFINAKSIVIKLTETYIYWFNIYLLVYASYHTMFIYIFYLLLDIWEKVFLII